jgi:hypothetical protein
MTRRTRGPGLAGLIRRWRPDRNPLRRTADRIEAVLIAGLIAAFLCGTPLSALAAAHSAGAAGLRAEHAQARWHQVPAVLLQDAPRTAHATMSQPSLEPLVPARWTAPGGAAHTGQVYAPGGTRAGSTVLVWTDGSGRLTGSPLRTSEVIGQVAIAASLATMIVAAVLAVLGLLARWALDRRRLAAWDAHWSTTGPQWTGRR